MLTLGSVFAAPILANEKQLSLDEFNRKLINALRSRYRHDSDKTGIALVINGLQEANSYRQAIDALTKPWQKCTEKFKNTTQRAFTRGVGDLAYLKFGTIRGAS